jgi:hypothetical protein
MLNEWKAYIPLKYDVVVNIICSTQIRIQTSIAASGFEKAMYSTPRQTISKIVAEEGVFAWWGGLIMPGMSATVMRELSYGCLRFSLYGPAKKLIVGKEHKGDAGLGVKISSGAISGGIGSFLANPTDVVKIRLQKEAGKVLDGVYITGLHAGQAPTYPTTLSAFSEIYKNEGGIRGLYRGWQPTVARACALVAAQLSTYDHTKYTMKQNGWMEEGPKLHVVASLFAAVNTAVVTQPFDTIKTLLMTGSYKSPMECVVTVVKQNGPLFLYRGFFPSLCRLGPHSLIALPLWERIRGLLGLNPV